MWINEAENACRYITPHLGLPAGSRILEVGSGACILLGHLARKHRQFEFTGIEPTSPGFETLKPYVMSLKRHARFGLFSGTYETFKPKDPFDLIYLINVFEHLDDWRHFLSFARDNLTANGKCVILCPNYGLPYESHYGIPILFTKNLTYRVFKSRIHKFDDTYESHGLWNSLNFVKYADLKKEAASLDLDLRFDPEISLNFIGRLDEDEEFRKRQGWLGTLAKLADRMGVARLIRQPLFWNYHPYMHLEISVGERNSNRTPAQADYSNNPVPMN